jgi:hypothetical protein
MESAVRRDRITGSAGFTGSERREFSLISKYDPVDPANLVIPSKNRER